MKFINQILANSVVVCGLSLTAAPVMAQTQDFIVNQFNDSTEADQWTRWWGSAVQTYEFDPAVDADHGTESALNGHPYAYRIENNGDVRLLHQKIEEGLVDK